MPDFSIETATVAQNEGVIQTLSGPEQQPFCERRHLNKYHTDGLPNGD
jgi:hypothetical protein